MISRGRKESFYRPNFPIHHNMAIIVNIDVMLAKRKMSVTELSEKLGITMANVSILKNGKAKAVKIETLNKLCKALDCQPGDLFAYEEDQEEER